jgi:hypothetical protein
MGAVPLMLKRLSSMDNRLISVGHKLCVDPFCCDPPALDCSCKPNAIAPGGTEEYNANTPCGAVPVSYSLGEHCCGIKFLVQVSATYEATDVGFNKLSPFCGGQFQPFPFSASAFTVLDSVPQEHDAQFTYVASLVATRFIDAEWSGIACQGGVPVQFETTGAWDVDGDVLEDVNVASGCPRPIVALSEPSPDAMLGTFGDEAPGVLGYEHALQAAHGFTWLKPPGISFPSTSIQFAVHLPIAGTSWNCEDADGIDSGSVTHAWTSSPGFARVTSTYDIFRTFGINESNFTAKTTAQCLTIPVSDCTGDLAQAIDPIFTAPMPRNYAEAVALMDARAKAARGSRHRAAKIAKMLTLPPTDPAVRSVIEKQMKLGGCDGCGG